MAMNLNASEMPDTMEFDPMDSSFDLIDYMLQFDDNGGHPFPESSMPFADALPTPTEESAPTPKPAHTMPIGPKRRRPRTVKQPAVVPPTRRRPRTQQPKSPVMQRPNDSPRAEYGLGAMEQSPPYAGVELCQIWDKPTGGPTSIEMTNLRMETAATNVPNLPPSPPSTAATSPTPSSHSLSASAPLVTYNFVNNQKSLSKSHAWTTIYNPTSNGLMTRVPDSTLAEIQNTVCAAQTALKTWRKVPYATRRSKMLQLAGVVRQNATRISTCLCTETGQTLQDSYQEVMHGIERIEFACSFGNDMLGTYVLNDTTQCHTIHDALGVCLTVTPFNSPFLTPLKSIPDAVMTGNTVILKPSEQSPSVAMLIAECFTQADFPPGVLNIVHGGTAAVTKLLSQPAIRAITFTGSDIAAERVYEHAIATRKRIQAFCGSKNHAVILEDAAQEQTLQAIAKSAFGEAGQSCTALSVVIFVGSSSSWQERLVQIASSLRLGNPSAPGVDIGPLISAQAKARVQGMIQGAIDEGATPLLDGRHHAAVAASAAANFLGPTILADVQPYMQCYQAEIFGPVLSCLTVETLDEAVELINDNKYGNTCSIFTANASAARQFQLDVNVGRVCVNVAAPAHDTATLPQSYTKESFLGDVTGQGRAGWQFFTQTKTVTSLVS